jgi:hypothetical protein
MNALLDGQRGRKPLSEQWTDAGWLHRSEWQVVLPGRHSLLVTINAKAGTVALSLPNEDEDDGA